MIPQEVAVIMDWLEEQFVFTEKEDVLGLAYDLYNKLEFCKCN